MGPERERGVVIIPTYNERENIQRVVRGIFDQALPLDVLVVDDNSPDGTAEAVRELQDFDDRVHLLKRPGKMGLGSAYLEGMAWALDRSYRYVFEMDADLSHDPKYLPDLFWALKDTDLVLGSRYVKGVNVVNWPLSRLLLSWCANLYARVITGLPVCDSTSGFKGFRREVLELVDLDRVRSDGYAFQIEMTFRAWRAGFRVVEVPIIFVDRRSGVSKMSKGVIWEAVWMVWYLRASALFGRL
ncbi:MAG: polyprenol monophosphomannose synthase [bacterium]